MDIFYGALKKTERIVLIILLILLTIVCFAQVFFRVALNDPLAWSEEVARYLFVWLTFIGAASAVGGWGHFQVDVLIGKLSGPWQKGVRYFSYLCILFFAYIMIFHGATLLQVIYTQKSPAMRISMSIPYLALPLSGVLMVVHLLEFVRNDLRGRKASREGAA